MAVAPQRARQPSGTQADTGVRGRRGLAEPIREFVDFLADHELQTVRLDIWLSGDAAQPVDSWLAATYFFLPEASPGYGEGYEISLNVDDAKKSPLTYAHGYWKLDSYVAVERPAGMWQGILARRLNPIPLEDVRGPRELPIRELPLPACGRLRRREPTGLALPAGPWGIDSRTLAEVRTVIGQFRPAGRACSRETTGPCATR